MSHSTTKCAAYGNCKFGPEYLYMNGKFLVVRSIHSRLLTAIVALPVFSLVSSVSTAPALAQNSERDMERLLNKVEDSRGMQQGIQTQQYKLNQQQMQQQQMQQQSGGGNQGTQNGYPGGYQNNYRGSNGFSYPQQQQQRNSAFAQSPIRQQQPVNQTPFASLFGGGQQAAQPAPSMPMTKRDLLRMFLDGGNGPSSSGNSQQAAYQKQQSNQSKYNNAASYRQTAEDAASRALGAEERTRYGNKSSRMSAADEAYYAAQAARGAANSATAAAAGGALNANDTAASARNAADRAQASADRARSNADSYREH